MFDTLCIIIGGITLLYLINANRIQIPTINNNWTALLVIGAIIAIYIAPEGFDRLQYKAMFENPGMWGNDKDPGWETYNSIYRLIIGTNSDLFFLIHDCIYTLLFVSFAFVALKPGYQFYFLLLVFISLGYFNGGTNVMRSGLANAIMYYGMSRYIKYDYSFKGIILLLSLAIIAITIHYSILLLIIGLIAGYFFPKVRWYFALWFSCLILSYFNVLESFLSPIIDYLGDSGDRLDNYVSQIGEANDLYRKTGWRLDFIIYSAIPTIFAYYYLKICNYQNRFYKCILCSYFVANSFWLCVIRMPFTDRIALISWCLIPLVTTYPLLSYNDELRIKKSSFCLLLAFLMPLGLHIINIIR